MRVFLILWAVLLPLAPAHAEVAKPAALVADGIPPVPNQLVADTRPYMEFRTAAFAGWNAADRSMLITTRFGNEIPLLVITGANDPRVPASAQGGQAWHLLGQNEGHGFAKNENADYQFWASLMFWKQTLLAE